MDVNIIRDSLDVVDTPAYQQPCTVMSPFLFLKTHPFTLGRVLFDQHKRRSGSGSQERCIQVVFTYLFQIMILV